ncbi:hypothetical protein CDAR_267471 [Caerostris darwini]|uniref:Uncharacterized protein n=1 Tax=Caerostris darwini TaxID=1538125 RepID=A0AAV4THU2_9ARAC|nr:hypothetical protein CDAR_267471 [Caerostris darwini]
MVPRYQYSIYQGTDWYGIQGIPLFPPMLQKKYHFGQVFKVYHSFLQCCRKSIILARYSRYTTLSSNVAEKVSFWPGIQGIPLFPPMLQKKYHFGQVFKVYHSFLQCCRKSIILARYSRYTTLSSNVAEKVSFWPGIQGIPLFPPMLQKKYHFGQVFKVYHSFLNVAEKVSFWPGIQGSVVRGGEGKGQKRDVSINNFLMTSRR